MSAFDIEQFKKDVHLLISEEPQTAVDRCDDALSRADRADHHRIHGLRAWALWSAGERERALADLEIARRLNPHWAAHLYHAADWLIDLQRFPEAVVAADQLLDLEAARSSIAFVDAALFIKAYALVRLGDNSAARSVLNRVKDEKPIWIGGRLISQADLQRAADESR